MLATDKLRTLEELVQASTAEELIWINGYLSGLVANQGTRDSGQAPLHNGQRVRKATICYGTETGNAKKLAIKITQALKQAGVVVNCKGLDQYRIEDLQDEKDFFVVVSTQGEGEPPESAKDFFLQLQSLSPNLSAMQFSVLALGDTAYPLYCKAGEDLDDRLAELGATRVLPMVKCDVDYEADAEAWAAALGNLYRTPESGGSGNDRRPAQETIQNPVAKPAVAPTKASAKKYYEGELIAHINLNDRGSTKQTWHLEIRCPEPIDYAPGDAIAIIPENRTEVVTEILKLAGVEGEQKFASPKGNHTARELLTRHLNICHLLGSTIKKYASLTHQDIPDTRMDLLDLLKIYPLPSAEEFQGLLQILQGIAPRLYSVSSSPLQKDNEVHLTVGMHRFLSEGDERFGLCSRFLGHLPKGSKIRFYVHRNKAFKLPDPEKDIIMIGPGTGVAPFRSFVGHRDATGASGRNWFFFGEQYFRTDFLYQLEWQQYLQTGVLHKLSLAFSRDQAGKIYVQDRMREASAELFSWLQQGAYFYVSGTKDPMSKDVENTLLSIIAQEGNLTQAEAAHYLETMKKEGRYQKDVY